MLTDVSQRYSKQYSYHSFHYAFKFIENFPFRIFFFHPELFKVLFFFWLRFIAVEKSLFLYFVKLIEISSRHVTGCHSLDHEFHSSIGNKESVENNIIFHFCFCLLLIKIALAIRWSTFSQELFGGSWLYVIVIYECLGHVELFMRSMQFVPALLYMNQIMEVSASNT